MSVSMADLKVGEAFKRLPTQTANSTLEKPTAADP
jgi:hypothetical protein